MRGKGIRALAIAIVIALVASVPVLAAKSRAATPTFRITAPVPDAYSGTTYIRWRWTGGSAMRNRFVSWSTVSQDGVIKIVTLTAPMWHGRTAWNTTTWTDGVYSLRAIVVGTTMRATMPSIIVDNTKPVVAITRPVSGGAYVNPGLPAANTPTDVTALPLPSTVVFGRTTFTAQASDNLSGIESVAWYLDEELVGQGEEVELNFATMPGEHEISVVATDRAGNYSDASMSFYAAGTTDAENPPSEPPSPGPVPSEVPSEAPGLPEAPEVPDVPDAPSEVPSPPAAPSPPATPPLPVGIPTL